MLSGHKVTSLYSYKIKLLSEHQVVSCRFMRKIIITDMFHISVRPMEIQLPPLLIGDAFDPKPSNNRIIPLNNMMADDIKCNEENLFFTYSECIRL